MNSDAAWERETCRLRAERDAAVLAAQAAIRDTTRLTRLLTVLSEPAGLERLLDRVLSTLSELFSADIVALLTPIDSTTCATLAAIGFPEDMCHDQVSAAPETFVATALRDQRPTTVDSAADLAHADPRLLELGVETAVWVPVMGGLVVTAVLVLGRCRAASFGQADVELLTAMAYRIGLALEQAQRRRQLEQLVQTGHELGRELSETAVIDKAVRMLPDMLRADAAAVILVDPYGMARCAGQFGLDPSFTDSFGCRADQLAAYSTLLTSQPYQVADLRSAAGRGYPLADWWRMRATLGVPISRKDRVDGLLYVFRFAPTTFSEDVVQIATLYAVQVGAALENARLYQQVSYLAFHDGLTGLPNRALFVQQLEYALERTNRHSGRVALLFVDLDNFKLVNDSLGHTFGDKVLVAAAERLQGCLRTEDTAARMGGDEFTVLLEALEDPAYALATAQRIGIALQAPLTVEGRTIELGASIGIAISGPGLNRPGDLLRKADLAMYSAKSSGRGRHMLFDDTLEGSGSGQPIRHLSVGATLDRRQPTLLRPNAAVADSSLG